MRGLGRQGTRKYLARLAPHAVEVADQDGLATQPMGNPTPRVPTRRDSEQEPSRNSSGTTAAHIERLRSDPQANSEGPPGLPGSGAGEGHAGIHVPAATREVGALRGLRSIHRGAEGCCLAAIVLVSCSGHPQGLADHLAISGEECCLLHRVGEKGYLRVIEVIKFRVVDDGIEFIDLDHAWLPDWIRGKVPDLQARILKDIKDHKKAAQRT